MDCNSVECIGFRCPELPCPQVVPSGAVFPDERIRPSGRSLARKGAIGLSDRINAVIACSDGPDVVRTFGAELAGATAGPPPPPPSHRNPRPPPPRLCRR